MVLKKESDKWVFAYEGLYVVFSANILVKNEDLGEKVKKDSLKSKKKGEPKAGDRFLIQGPFTYEMKF
ncbi:hypothetical protein [Tenacibaculum maritimum]|uniref:hypothetical protein n=1 Tax=Tenacibaculum maritimum TaxID=107401 RepID=UPI0038774A91